MNHPSFLHFVGKIKNDGACIIFDGANSKLAYCKSWQFAVG